MKCASTVRLDFANLNNSAKENTTVKSAKTSKPARPLKHAPKDTQRDARKVTQIMDVILEMTVPKNME